MTRRGQRQPQRQPQRPQPRPQPNLHQQEGRLFRRDYEATAGWCQPMAGGFWHYFHANDALSLCGRWLFSGAARENSNHDRADACVECAARRRQTAESEVER